MAEYYVDAERLQESLQRREYKVAQERYREGWNDCLMRVKSMVHSMKTDTVAPIRHGKWIEKPYLVGITHYCSLCDENYMPCEAYNYCPNCGAKMDKE